MKTTQTWAFASLILLFTACTDNAPPSRETVDVSMPDSTALIPDAGPVDAAPVVVEDAALRDMAIPDMAIEIDAADIPVSPDSIETEMGVTETVAGTSVRVACTVRDSLGEVMDGVRTQVDIRPTIGWTVEEGEEGEESTFMGQLAGDYTVRCLANRAGLRDESPETWTVTPGAAIRTRAVIDTAVIEAGGSAEVTCQAVDTFGNRLDMGQPTVTALQGAPLNINGTTVSGTRSGEYALICPMDGAINEPGFLSIVPGPPNNLVVALVPALPVYRVNTILTVNVTVVDEYGNAIPGSPLTWSTAPELPDFGPGRYQLAAEGTYTITVSTGDPAAADTIARSFVVEVDSSGPSIECTGPGEGAMVRIGDPTVLQGRVMDMHQIGLVEIDGIPVPVDEEGRFAWAVEPIRGVNVHTISALDAFGNGSQTFCAFFAADDYLAEDASLANSIVLDFRPNAIDNGAPANPIESLGDMFRFVIESESLINTLNQQALAQNPLINNRCIQDSWFGCIVRASVRYRSMEVRGARTVNLGLYDGGISLNVRLNNIRLNLTVSGTLSANGAVDASFLEVSGRFALSTVNGVASLELVQNSASIQVGNLSSDFSGFSGLLIDLVFPLVEGTIRGELTDTLQDFVFEELDTILSGALAGLDLSAFSLGFDIQAPDGREIAISLATALSTMNATEDRMRIGMGTRVNGPVGQARPSAGIPVFGDLDAIERAGPGNMGAMIHLTMVNQLMHGLWRAGFFDLANADGLLGAEGGAFGFTFELLVPPAVEGKADGTGLRVHFGPARASLAYPELFDDPLQLRIASTLSVDVSINGQGELEFGANGLEFEDLRLLIEDVAMEPEDQVAVEQDLGLLVRNLAGQALNQALPSLPVPEIALPNDLAEYGVPLGTKLGLRNPQLNVNPTHILLDGNLGQ